MASGLHSAAIFLTQRMRCGFRLSGFEDFFIRGEAKNALSQSKGERRRPPAWIETTKKAMCRRATASLSARRIPPRPALGSRRLIRARVVLDVADHHLVEGLLAPSHGRGRIGIGGIAGAVVVDGGDLSRAAGGGGVRRGAPV